MYILVQVNLLNIFSRRRWHRVTGNDDVIVTNCEVAKRSFAWNYFFSNQIFTKLK